MKGKICMITGATSGIGKAAAISLAGMGATIVIICRDVVKGLSTMDEMKQVNNTSEHLMLVADLSRFDSVRKCIDEFKNHFNHLDVLINNAGVFYTDLKYSDDHIEMQFAVNYLAAFLITNLVAECLMKCENSRIINSSSVSHYIGKIHFNDLNFASRYDGFAAYNQSKLANLLFTKALAARLQGSGITVNCCSPGRVNTHIGDAHSKGFWKYLWILNKPVLIDVNKGAVTPVFLASSDEAAKYNGEYFYKCKPVWSSRRSRKKPDAERLWKISSELTGIDSFTLPV